jgi:hypothetical protein
MLAPQCLVAVVSVILNNGVSKMAYLWFPEDERAIAISLVSLGNPIGAILGMLIGPQFISETRGSLMPV